MKDYQKIKELFESSEDIVIITHQKPDGDAMGSLLGLFNFLSRKGHNVTPVSPTDYAHFLKWMPGEEHVLNYQKDQDQILTKLSEAELIVCVDFNNPDRINNLKKPLINATGTKLVIDHHTNPEPFFDYIICESDICATTELIFQIVDNLWGHNVILSDMAACLYTGIVTDSGSFRFSNVTPTTHKIAAKLLQKQIDHSLIHRNLFDNNPLRKLRFLGFCLQNRLEVLEDCRTAYIYITREDYHNFDIETGETEGMVNYPLSLEGIVFAALIKEREKIIKISFRSIGNFPANGFASRFFEGGGHFNAAGGKSTLDLNQTLKKFKEKVHETKAELEQH